MDVQTVDGFIFPLTITLNNQINVAGQQYGQPVYTSGQTATVNRADIFTAFTSFMQGEGTAGQPYLDLIFGAGSVAGQAGGILNPGAYLSAVDSTNQFLHLDSSLNTVWNTDLTTLFSTTTLRVQGAASGAGDSGPVIPAQSYTVTPVTQTYPNTSVSLPALTFTGETDASVFHVLNPVGLSVLTNDAGGAITGTINGNTLTLNSPVSALQTGMYVSGAGIPTAGGNSTTTISVVSGNNKVFGLSGSFGKPAPNSQYVFSKLPALVTFQTPGQMVFANSGVFADNTVQFGAGTSSATVLGSLENFLVTALNRGVALNATALNPGSSGGTSAVWGNQTNWYPAGTTQNLFSLFMHVGQINGTPIFFQPANAAAWPNARGQTMGAAYGFAFDENGGPVPPAPVNQPEVPSKFDQNVPVGATIQITFGPWSSPLLPDTTTVAAVLPLSRSVQVGGAPATAFALILNTGSAVAANCQPAQPSSPPGNLGTFTYQTTTPANVLSGSPNTPANIAPGAFQNYVFGFSPTGSVPETSLAMRFICDNATAPQHPGVNNFFIVADTAPVPDTIALMATVSGDGVVRIPGSSSTQLYAIGTSNVGATGTIIVSGDTGGLALPLMLTVCETTGGSVCLANPTPSVTVNYLAGTNRSFAFFAQASGSIAFDPANNRVFARLKESGVTRGATSAAVCTVPNAGC
jgi:hypothetical protein